MTAPIIIAPLVGHQMLGGLCRAHRVGVRVNELSTSRKPTKVFEIRLAVSDHADLSRQLHAWMVEHKHSSIRMVALVEEPATTFLINEMLDAEILKCRTKEPVE
jgi:hypothetical protein